MVLSTLANSVEVTSVNEMADKHLHELSSDLSSIKKEVWCQAIKVMVLVMNCVLMRTYLIVAICMTYAHIL